MSDNLKMFFRYGFAVLLSFAVGKGWITPEQSETVNGVLIQIAGLVLSMFPAVYAALKIDNTPKT